MFIDGGWASNLDCLHQLAIYAGNCPLSHLNDILSVLYYHLEPTKISPNLDERDRLVLLAESLLTINQTLMMYNDGLGKDFACILCNLWPLILPWIQCLDALCF